MNIKRNRSPESARRLRTSRRQLHVETLENRQLLAGDFDVRLRFETTSLTGDPVSSVHVGDHFKLNVLAQDMRATPEGVFAGYLDLNFDPTRVSVALRERELIEFTGNTGGSFQLTFQNETTGDIAFSPTDPAGLGDGVRAALESLASIEPGDVSVTVPVSFGGQVANVIVQFGGQFANQNVPNMTIDASGLIGGAGATVREEGGAQPGNPQDLINSVQFGPKYPNGRAADGSTPGLLDEIGAFDGSTPVGAGEQLLFSVEYIATAGGLNLFSGDAADMSPSHDVLVYGLNTSIPTDRVQYGITLLEVVGAPPPEPILALDLGLQVTDLDGAPVSNLRVGQEFLLHGTAQDIRELASGPFAAYMDVTFASNRATVVGGISHAAPFDSGVAGDTQTPGLIDEAGGFSTSTEPLGGRIHELFSVRMRATQVGTLTFHNDPPDNLPAHHLLVFGHDQPVTARYHDLSITVLPGPTARPDQFAVNENTVTPTVLNVRANDTNAVQVVAVTQGTQGGRVEIGPTGQVLYVPATNFVGRETFTYTIGDGLGGRSSASVTMTVRRVDLASLSGFVYVDGNSDGIKQTDEAGIPNATVKLLGVNADNRAVVRTVRTDSQGRYTIGELGAGTYRIVETQPSGFLDGRDTVGSQGGRVERNDVFFISLGKNVAGVNNNFGERLVAAPFAASRAIPTAPSVGNSAQSSAVSVSSNASASKSTITVVSPSTTNSISYLKPATIATGTISKNLPAWVDAVFGSSTMF